MGDIFPLMTRLEHRVQRPRAGANVNEALTRRRHHLAEGRGPSLSGPGVLSFSIISSDVIITSVTSPADHVNNDAIIITGLLWL